MAKKYFNAAHCNEGWAELESDTAKRERGHGWSTFCKTVRGERGNRCEICGVEELSKDARAQLSRRDRQRFELHLHHKLKLSMYRHLRFERSNVVVCCVPCHKKLEAELDALLATVSSVESGPSDSY
jgi:hypothetical protein